MPTERRMRSRQTRNGANAMRIGLSPAVTEAVKGLERTGFTSADEMAGVDSKMNILSGGKGKTLLSGSSTARKHYWPIIGSRPAKKAVHYLTGAGDDIHPAFVAGSTIMSQYWMYPGPYVSCNYKTILLLIARF